MRIACIYWPTSSVGGINTGLNNLRWAAMNAGHTWDILVSGLHSTIPPHRLPERKTIRGGDTYITIDGYASHHPKQVNHTLRFLRDNYDLLVFGYLCPHPNKAYGTEPHFLRLFRDTPSLPKIARVTDAYWDTYAEWGEEALRHVRTTFVVNDAYAQPLLAKGYNVVSSVQPYLRHSPAVMQPRAKRPLLTWTSQWKAIKSLHRFLPQVPLLPPDVDVEMFSNGILYYQMRTEEVWKAAVAQDHFQGFHGHGRAHFHGHVELPMVAAALQQAWWMVNWQGMGKPKYKAYQQGSYNNTEIEALDWGALPILHSQVLLSRIPSELIATVEAPEELPDLLLTSREFALDPERQRRAREWVADTHDASIVLGQMLRAWGVAG